MKRKPENQVFHFGLENVALKDLDIAHAHRAASRFYYERNREKILEKRKTDYYKKKELTEVKK